MSWVRFALVTLGAMLAIALIDYRLGEAALAAALILGVVRLLR